MTQERPSLSLVYVQTLKPRTGRQKSLKVVLIRVAQKSCFGSEKHGNWKANESGLNTFSVLQLLFSIWCWFYLYCFPLWVSCIWLNPTRHSKFTSFLFLLGFSRKLPLTSPLLWGGCTSTCIHIYPLFVFLSLHSNYLWFQELFTQSSIPSLDVDHLNCPQILWVTEYVSSYTSFNY